MSPSVLVPDPKEGIPTAGADRHTVFADAEATERIEFEALLKVIDSGFFKTLLVQCRRSLT